MREVCRYLRGRAPSLALMNVEGKRDFLAETPTSTINTRPAGVGSRT